MSGATLRSWRSFAVDHRRLWRLSQDLSMPSRMNWREVTFKCGVISWIDVPEMGLGGWDRPKDSA